MGTKGGIAALREESGYAHHKWHALVVSGKGGCALCRAAAERLGEQYSQFAGDVQRQDKTTIDQDVRVNVRATYSKPDEEAQQDGVAALPLSSESCVFSKLVFYVSFGSVALEAGFNIETASDDPAAPYVAHKTEFKEFNDEVSLNLRKSVIDCLTEHNIDDCPGKKTGQLPRRVLDVGAVRSDETVDEDGPVKLKESREGDRAIYTTLSYCWGDSEHQITTTKATLQARLEGLPPMHQLPKTIADAVKVTRHLGIQYLWVDALCIIQDDEIDKLEQIDAMSDIFRNSTVTIAASSAFNVSEGFLSTAKPLKVAAKLPLVLSENKDSIGLGTIYLRGDWISASVYDEPLYSRAWTFQETILSPRVLDFNTYNSVHMCSDQDYPPLFSGHKITGHEWPGSEIFKGIHRLEASDLFQSLYFAHPRYLFRVGEFERDKWGIWREVIYEYSKRNITLPSDRLPALSGIAKRLSPFAGDYVAGLWKESIVHYLGWEHSNMKNWPQSTIHDASGILPEQDDSGNMPEPRPSPSWSWVSVPYGVSVAPLLKTHANMVDCQIIPVSDINPHGQVRQGILTIRATTLRFSDLPLEPSFLRDGTAAAIDEIEPSIKLDYRETVPGEADRASIRFIYLGLRSHFDGEYEITLKPEADARTFLVVNRAGQDVNFRRIGTLHILEKHQKVQSGELQNILDSKEPNLISIE